MLSVVVGAISLQRNVLIYDGILPTLGRSWLILAPHRLHLWVDQQLRGQVQCLVCYLLARSDTIHGGVV